MTRRFVASQWTGWSPVAIVALLAGCGGGGNAPDSIAVPESTVQVTGKAVDATGAGIAGAEVLYQYSDKAPSVLTNGQGTYDLRLPASQVAGIENPAVCVIKDGFESEIVTYPTFEGGSNYSSTVTLSPLQPNVSIPKNAQCLWHLGDDNFIGGLNAKLQKKSDGLVKAFPIEDWAAKVATGRYTKVRIVMLAKGWQTDICPNTVSLVGAVIGQEATLPGGLSADDGWASYTFEFDIAAIGTTSANLVIATGACLPNDFDDFEFMKVRAEFL